MVLATAIAKVRIGLAAGVLVLTLRLILTDQWRTYLPTVVVSAVYSALAFVVWRLLKSGRLVKRAGWLVPLLDAPLVAIAQLLQTSHLPVPLMGMVNTPVMMLGMVVLATLSL